MSETGDCRRCSVAVRIRLHHIVFFVAGLLVVVPALFLIALFGHWNATERGKEAVREIEDFVGQRGGFIRQTQRKGNWQIACRGKLTDSELADLASAMRRLPPPQAWDHVGCIELDIGETRVTDVGLRHLSGLKLCGLGVADTTITDAGIESLAEFRIGWLDVAGTKITDRAMKTICTFHLWSLSIKRTSITDASVPPLEKLMPIADLRVAGTRISEAGLRRLEVVHGVQRR